MKKLTIVVRMIFAAALIATVFLTLLSGLKTWSSDTGKKAVPPPKVAQPKMNYKLPLDEKLVYDVKAFGLPLATQTNNTRGIVDKNGRKAVNIFVTIKTHRWVILYSIDNTMETFIDAETLKPLLYEERSKEKDWAAIETDQFMPNMTKYHKITGLKLDKEEKGEHKYAPADWPQDELSIVYYIRHIDLEKNKKFTINACVDHELQTATVVVVKKQKLETIHGKKDVFYITSTLGESKFYIGADDLKIPYQFEVKLNFGRMKAILKEYSPQPKK